MLRFFDRVRSTLSSRFRSGSCRLPLLKTASAPEIVCFRGSIARPACAPVNASPIPLRNLRMTRGRRGSLFLRRRAFSSPSPSRFIPAHFENVDPIGRVHVGKEQPRETDAKRLDSVLMEAAKGGDEEALALLVQIYLGLRPGEVLSLQVDAIERQGTKVSITRGKTTNAKRSLELFADVAVLLWRHCQGRPGEQRVFAAALPQKPATNWMYKRLHRPKQPSKFDCCEGAAEHQTRAERPRPPARLIAQSGSVRGSAVGGHFLGAEHFATPGHRTALPGPARHLRGKTAHH